MQSYIAAFHPAGPDDGTWGVTFPDVPGCVSSGASFAEAWHNAHDALNGHLALMIADRDPLPAARPLEQILAAAKADPDLAEEIEGAFLQLVTPRQVAAPKQRVNVMIDPLVLRSADEAAEAEGLSRSAFIERVVKTAVGAG